MSTCRGALFTQAPQNANKQARNKIHSGAWICTFTKLSQLNLLYPLDLTGTQHELVLVRFLEDIYIFIMLPYSESSILDYPDLTASVFLASGMSRLWSRLQIKLEANEFWTSWPLIIMLNMQSLAWHFKFARNVALFSLQRERDDFRSQDLVVYYGLRLHLCSNNWMCEARPLVPHTGHCQRYWIRYWRLKGANEMTSYKHLPSE